MNHKARAFFVALALCLFAVPAFGANTIGAPDATVPPGVNTISVQVDNDVDLRGIGFSWELVLTSGAGSVNVTNVTVTTPQLTSQRVSAIANTGSVFLAGRDGADDLAAGTGTAIVDFEIDFEGVTGDVAELRICGVDPWPDNPIFVGTDDNPVRYLVDCATTTITVQALVVADLIAACPERTYEGGAIAIHMGSTVAEPGVFVSLDLIGGSKDGSPVSRQDLIDAGAEVTGLGLVDAPDAPELIFFYATQPGDAGVWEFCFEATDDLGNADTTCVPVTVEAPDADHVYWTADHIEFNPAGPFAYAFGVNTVHSYDSTYGIVLPFEMKSVSGGAFFDAPVINASVAYPPEYDVFESKSTNTFGNDAVTPDSLLMGLIDFGETALDPGGPYTVTVNSTLKDVEGIIRMDITTLPPANELSYNVTNVTTIVPTYSPGCYALTIVRNLPPTVSCPVESVGPVIFGDPVSIPGFSYDDPDGGPGPYTFEVVSATKDGDPEAAPTNDPYFEGDTFMWQTVQDEGQNDVGFWTFCVIVNDGVDNSTNECCFRVEVIAQLPLIGFSFGCLEAFSNQDICVPLYIDNLACSDDCQEIGGFDLLFTYDATMLTFKGMNLEGSVLEAAGWEYFTYRIVSTNPALIRIVAIADMNNSNQHPDDYCIDGLLANVCFRTTNDRNLACQSANIRFYWDDCGDNTASSKDGEDLYIIADPYGQTPWCGGDPTVGVPGGGIISNSCEIEDQMATFEGGITGPADFPCANPDPQKPDPIQFLYFVNGKVKIKCPGDIDDRGDLNLNAIAYEIADAVLYSNYFIYGPSVFTINPEGQIAASDVNADGMPLTVADLVYLIRVITGDAEPIAEDLLGGGPKVAAAVGKINVVAAQQGTNVSISASSDADLGAGLFVFKYTGTEIADVSLTGRASDMALKYEALNGELRVLVLPRMSADQVERQMVSAGTGEILSIATHGVGEIELVSVEAASFMGGALEAAVEAKVLPTQFALRQNFPNPFNPSTSMAIDFPTASEYKLTIYNIAGQVVKAYEGQTEAGTLTIVWDGTDARGAKVASGVYFYSVQAGEFADVRKMVLMK